jgi:hypothetical protein
VFELLMDRLRMADYLLAEVLERQPDELRRLLLRTPVLVPLPSPVRRLAAAGLAAHRAG